MARTKTLNLGDGVKLPLEAVTQTFAIIAKRGRGKTYTANVLVEEMLEHRQRVVVIDPVGVWWGLRSGADGNRAGYPVLILGGDHGDLPLEADSGELVADLIVDHDLAVVIDLSLLRKGQQRTFMVAFAERLYHRNRKPLHLVVDEADAYAPQRTPKGEGARLLGAMEDLVRRGRARGIGVTLISQRAAVLNKDVLTQTEVLIALQVTGPQDRAALDAWIRQHGSDDQRAELLDTLASLPIGTAWIWSPGWLDLFRRVQIRTRRTFDSSATPKVGETITVPSGYATVGLDHIRERMADVVDRAQAEDPRQLRRRIAELERQLEQADRVTGPEPEIVEVPVVDLELLEHLERQLEAARSTINDLDGRLQQTLDQLRQAARAPKTAPARPSNTSPTSRPPRRTQQQPRPTAAADTPKLRDGARRMLDSLASFHPDGMTRPQLGGLAGLSHRGGTFSTYLSDLRRHNLIEEHDGLIHATEAGLDAAGVTPSAPPSTVDDLVAIWDARLRAGAIRMLHALIDAHPAPLTRADLAEQAGIEATGGTFSTYLSDLRRYSLAATDHDHVRLGDAFERLERR